MRICPPSAGESFMQAYILYSESSKDVSVLQKEAHGHPWAAKTSRSGMQFLCKTTKPSLRVITIRDESPSHRPWPIDVLTYESFGNKYRTRNFFRRDGVQRDVFKSQAIAGHCTSCLVICGHQVFAAAPCCWVDQSLDRLGIPVSHDLHHRKK